FRGGRLAEAVDDVCNGLEFWRTRVESHGLDARAISLVGLSAGASLAMLAASRSPVHRVAACFGLYDVEHLRGPAALLPRLLFASADRSVWRAASPVAVPQPTAPVLLLHGTNDGLTPVPPAHHLAALR